jgi:predicted enzyme related to lactoylglutathione lyase
MPPHATDEGGPAVDFKIELIPIAVTDVDRAKAFYADSVGWPVDHDQKVSDDLRFVQITPPGSACSFCFGVGLGMMPQGSRQFIQIVVADADGACAYLRERGVECSDVEELAWGRFVNFQDPDGNRWALQQLVPRQGV